MVVNEGVSGVGVDIMCQSSNTAININTKRHMEVLHDSCLNINQVSQEVLVAWSFMHPVICAMKENMYFNL